MSDETNDPRQDFINGLADAMRDIGLPVESNNDGVFIGVSVSNGASWYDGDNTLLYRGDGANATISLPAGKVVDRVSPAQHLVHYPERVDILAFASAIPYGELVTITLRDAE